MTKKSHEDGRTAIDRRIERLRRDAALQARLRKLIDKDHRVPRRLSR